MDRWSQLWLFLSRSSAVRHSVVALMIISAALFTTNTANAQSSTVPTFVRAVAGSGYVNVYWQAAANASSYNVYRGTTAGGEAATPIATNITSNSYGDVWYYTDSTVTNGTTYYYKVTANTFNGISGYSNEASADPGSTQLAAPVLRGGTGNQDALLNWSPVTGATSYQLYRSIGSGNGNYLLYQSGLTGTSYNDTALTNGATYNYYVAAVNLTGVGASSSAVSVVPGEVPLTGPAGVHVTTTNGNQLTVYWNYVPDASGYNIYRGTTSGGEGTVPYATSASSSVYNGYDFYFTDTNVTAGTTYYYYITAKNSVSESSHSLEVSGVLNSSTNPPPHLSGAGSASPVKVVLNWSAVTGATSYDVFRAIAGTNDYTSYASTTATTYTDTSVSLGVSYNYFVDYNTGVHNQGDSGAISNVVTVTPGGALLPAPTGLEATLSGGVTLTWNAVPGTSTYNVYRGTTAGGEGSVPIAVNVSSSTSSFPSPNYVDSTVTAGSTYYYFVTAVGSNGESGKSNEASITDTAANAPAAPTALNATSSTTQIALSWTGSTGATSYNIYRNAGGAGFVWLANQAGTTYTDSAVSSGISYVYFVTAANTYGQSTDSNQAGGTPGQPALPAPTGLNASQYNSSTVYLTWNSVPGSSSYNVYEGTTAGGETAVPVATGITNTTSYIGSLTSGTTYYFKVTAVNSGGQSAKSNEASATPGGAGLSAPNLIATTPSSTQVVLSWSAVAGATSYNIYRSIGGTNSFAELNSTSSTTYTDTGLTAGLSDSYYVVAVSVGGSSGGSNTVTVVPTSPALPAPTGIYAYSSSANQVYVVWNYVPGAASYNLYRGTTAGGEATIPIATGITSTYNGQYAYYTNDSTAVSGTTYYYKVTAVDSYAESPLSSEASATPGGTNPIAPVLTASSGATSIVLNWSAVTGATSYTLRREDQTGYYSTLVDTAATTFTDATAVPGVTYYYYVFADAPAFANGANSNTVSAALNQVKLGAPTDLIAYSGGSGAYLYWNPVVGASSYNVYLATTSGAEGAHPFATGVSAPSYYSTYYIGSLTAGTKYYFEVTAVGAGGESAKSAEATATPGSTVPAATSLTVSTVSGQAKLTWSAVTGATSYVVFRAVGTNIDYSTIVTTTTGTTATDSTVTNGLTYSYQVYAVSAVGYGAGSNVVTVLIDGVAPPAPTGFVAYPTSTTNNQLLWNPLPGITSYNVYRSTTAGGEGTTPYATNVGSPTGDFYYYNDGSVTSGTTYYYKITAVNSVGESAKSVEASATPGATTLAAPILVATNPAGKVTLTWSTVTGATSYQVYRNYAGQGYLSLTNTTAATYTDSTIANGVPVSYYVAAISSAGLGASSNVVSLVPGGSTLAAPTGLAATNDSSANIYLTWNAAPGAASYNIYKGPSAGTEAAIPIATSITSLYFDDSQVVPGLSYYYKVTAVNTYGESAKSNEATAKDASTVPSSPNLKVQGSGTSAILTWTTVSGATGYNVYRSVAGATFQYLAETSALTYSNTSLTTGLQYSYYVTAIGPGGQSSGSNTVNVTLGGVVLPAPFGATAYSQSNYIVVSWNAVPGASNYNIYRGTSSGGEAATPYNVGYYSNSYNGLLYYYLDYSVTPGTTYYYTVTATSGAGESAHSNETSATYTLSRLPAPTLTATNGTGQVSLNWTAVTGATSYAVFKSVGANGNYSLLSTSTGTTYTDSSVISGQPYAYFVCAVNVNGQGNNSNTVTLVAGSSALGAPTDVFVDVQHGNTLDVIWQAVPGASFYNVYRSTTSGGEGTAPLAYGITPGTNGPTGLYFQDTTAVSGQVYYYEVTAANANGESPKSSEASGELGTASLGTPVLTGSASGGTITLNWTAVSGATSYIVLKASNVNSQYSVLTNVTGTTYADTATQAGLTYSYEVIAATAQGAYGISNVVTISPNGVALPAPVGVEAFPTGSEIGVAWNTVPGATNYYIYRSLTSGGEGAQPFATGGYSLPYSGGHEYFYDNTVTNDQTYYYYVTAVNGYSQSAPSAETSAQQYGTQLPAPVLTATPGAASAVLNWSTVPGAVGYRVFRIDPNNIFTVIYTGTANTYTDTSLINGENYTYFTGSYNAIGSSPGGNTVTVTAGTAGGSPLSAATLVATAGDNNVALTWTNIPGATSYTIYRSTTTGKELPLVQGLGVASGGTTSYTDTTAANYTTYFYKVAAVNGYGAGILSNEVTATPPNTSVGNFLLIPTPKVIAIAAGTENTVTVGVNLYNGVTGVNLAVTGLPANVTATFDPSFATTTGSYLNLYAATTAAVGVYTITVTGTAGTETESTTVTVQILPAGSTLSTQAIVEKSWDIRGDSTPSTVRRASLLDEVGHLVVATTEAQASSWRRDLHLGRLGLQDAAREQLWLGEFLLANDQQPEEAIDHFAMAAGNAAKASSTKSGSNADSAMARIQALAKYDSALALFYSGAYADARDAFYSLLTSKADLPGLDRRICAIWWRHGVACAGYHSYRASEGIPEPPRLDPKCGVSALAACLRGLGLPYDEHRVLAACRVTGEGSSLADLVAGAPKLGVTLRAVNADDKGLMLLPKPVVAYVEHDHFIAVTKADKSGVNYLCSDCGAWPGGPVHLNWRQWHLIEASRYAVATVPGSAWDDKLIRIEALERDRANGRNQDLASLNLHNLLAPAYLVTLATHVQPNYIENNSTYCGLKEDATHCQPWINCPSDGGCGGGGTTGPKYGDPVNLATGELEYTPSPDLTVYNPYGPNVTWSRVYDSLRSSVEGAYEFNDYGQGWSQPYNVGVYDTNPGSTGTKYVFFSNGARTSFTASAVPTATAPTVLCTVEPGAALIVQWNYSANLPYGYYTVTFPDRTVWTTTGYASTPQCFLLSKLSDRNGNALTFNYRQPVDGNGWPLLTTIVNSAGTALLTIRRAPDGTGNIAQVTDSNSRSIYYHNGFYPTKNVPNGYVQSYQQVDHISQIVVAHSTAKPDHYAHTYSLYTNGEGVEQVPYLTSISVPSPTGTGTATATETYNTTTAAIASTTDANGNERVYTPVNSSGQATNNGNYTKVEYYNPSGDLEYTYTVSFDSNMNETGRYVPAGPLAAGQFAIEATHPNAVTAFNLSVNTPQYTWAFSDPNDPYKPSSITDANGHTTSYTYDPYGNVLTNTSARGTLTTNTYNYTNFSLGELTKTVVGTKSPTSYTYFEPSGLIASITAPVPGTVGSTSTVTTSFTYDTTSQGTHGLGNTLTVTRPGNNAATSITTTYNYTTDGSYTQKAAIAQPVTVTDALGHITHYRYDTQGNLLSVTDPIGNVTSQTYNIANQPLATTYPATGQGGTYNANLAATYLYPAGPLDTTVLTGENDAVLRTTDYTYGAEGELLSRFGGDESAAYTYNSHYQVASLSDGNGNATKYYYNTAGFLTAILYPGYSGAAYPNASGKDSVNYTSYDVLGDPLVRVDGNGVTTDYTYNDPENLLTNIVYPSKSTLNVKWTYDGYGRRSSMTDGTGTVNYSYGDDDSPVSTTTTYTGLTAQTISYTYYNDDSREAMTTPAGAFSYLYDAAGRATSVKNPAGESTTYTYANNNWATGYTLANGTIVADTYNARGFLTNLVNETSSDSILSEFGGTSSSTENVYDAAGDRTQLNATVTSTSAYTGVTNYTFDGNNELTGETSTRNGDYTNSFVYDLAGNPTTFRSAASNTFNSDNQITAFNKPAGTSFGTFAYDGDGNPTTYDSSAFTYDPENRITAISTLFTAGYNADNLRAWSAGSSGTKTYFLYDGSREIVELSSTGAVAAYNTFGPTGLVSRHASTTSTFYTFDPQGNVAERLNSSGTVVNDSLFDAFGYSPTTATDPFGFGAQWGYYTDSQTGLVLSTFRYYDAGAGRWLTRDPISYGGGINLYSYVQNQPTRLIDPAGTSGLILSGGIVGSAEAGPLGGSGEFGGVYAFDSNGLTISNYASGSAGVGIAGGVSPVLSIGYGELNGGFTTGSTVVSIGPITFVGNGSYFGISFSPTDWGLSVGESYTTLVGPGATIGGKKPQPGGKGGC